MLDLITSSRSLSAPVYAYEVSHPGGVIRFTSSESPLSFEGNTFERRPCAHGRVSASGSLDGSDVTLDVDLSNPVAELFRQRAPESVVTLRILRGELSDPTLLPIWHGRILNFAIRGRQVSFTCEPVATSVKRPGLRRTYQLGCPYALYGPQCKVNIAEFRWPAFIESIEGNEVRMVPGWHPSWQPYERWVGGLLTRNVEGRDVVTRQIIEVVNENFMRLDQGTPDLGPGSDIFLALGCPRTVSGCRDIFANVLNYGGQPWIPLDNPLGGQNNFY